MNGYHLAAIIIGLISSGVVGYLTYLGNSVDSDASVKSINDNTNSTVNSAATEKLVDSGDKKNPEWGIGTWMVKVKNIIFSKTLKSTMEEMPA